MAERSPEDIAAALVHAHRARMPAPEDLLGSEAAQEQRGPRPGFEGSVWFRMNIGRNQNADPRWILPLLCRRGHLSRGDIGAIRLAADESMFEVARGAADRFLEAVRRTAQDEDDGVIIIPFDGAPRDEAKQNRRDNARNSPPMPKPYRKPESRPKLEARPGAKPGARPPHAGPKGPGALKHKGAWKKGPHKPR